MDHPPTDAHCLRHIGVCHTYVAYICTLDQFEFYMCRLIALSCNLAWQVLIMLCLQCLSLASCMPCLIAGHPPGPVWDSGGHAPLHA